MIPVFSLLLQEVIDIFEGVREDQALRMASNLGFKGPLERQVMRAAGSFHCSGAEEPTHACWNTADIHTKGSAVDHGASHLDARSRLSFY